MIIDYRQQVVEKIANTINPSVSFRMDSKNNIIIPNDEESCKTLILANTIVDNLTEILGFNINEITEIYAYLLEKHKNVTDKNISNFLTLLRLIGVDHLKVKQ